MPPRRRVLFVHHRSEAGGAPKSLALIMRELRGEIEAFVLCPEGEAAEQFREAGAEVLTAPVASLTHIWASVYRGPRWVLLAGELLRLRAHLTAFREALIQIQPQIVHLNDAPLVPAAHAAARAGVPVIWHLRSALPPGDSRRSRYLRSQVARLAFRAVAINDDVARSYATDRLPAVVYDPVSLPEAGYSQPDLAAKSFLGLNPAVPAIGMVSNLYAAKGWEDLVEASGMLTARGIRHQVMLVGSPVRDAKWHKSMRGKALGRVAGVDDPQSKLAEMVDQLGLEDSVRHVPFQESVDRVYRALDLVCFPSRGPEIGRPVIEGQAYGLPVVTSGSTGGGGLIEDGKTGFLVPQQDPRALAATLERLIADPALRNRIGRNARVHAESRYSTRYSAAQINDLYSEALRPASRGRSRHPVVPLGRNGPE